MKPIDFPERTNLVAEHQDEYTALPAHITPKGEVIFCVALSFRERCKLLFTGRIWCSLLMFNNPKTGKVNPTTPSFFTVNKKDLFHEKN